MAVKSVYSAELLLTDVTLNSSLYLSSLLRKSVVFCGGE